MKPSFPGFSPDAPKFLADLEQNNDREWFQPRKEHYERVVREPMTALVMALNEGLAKFAPGYVTDPKQAIFRIYRDVRFSKNKQPYKTHIAASFGGGCGENQIPGVYYFSFSHKSVEAGGGVYHPDPPTMLTIRNHIAATHEVFRKLLKERKLRALMGELRGEELSRAPKGFDPEHPAADLLKKKDWFLFADLDPALLTTPKLLPELLARFAAVAPVIDYLNAPMKAAKKKAATIYRP